MATTTHPTPAPTPTPHEQPKPAHEPTKAERETMAKAYNQAGTPPNAPDYDVADEAKPGSPAEAARKAAAEHQHKK